MGISQNQVDLNNQSSAISATFLTGASNPGQRMLITGRVTITDPALLGSIRVRFVWDDPDAGASQDDYVLTAVGLGSLPFTFPVNITDATNMTYQVDFLSVTLGGSFAYSLVIDTVALYN